MTLIIQFLEVNDLDEDKLFYFDKKKANDIQIFSQTHLEYV